MKQYLELGKEILGKGTYKSPARENMPGTLSLFGAQFRHNLQDGFPLLTTKKINFKHIVAELLWFMSGDTNIKFLVDNGCNIWNEDAYNYYLKKCKENDTQPVSFESFITAVKENRLDDYLYGFKLGDCGKQYGWLWRSWTPHNWHTGHNKIDQLKELIDGLKSNPMSRRHIITAWNPATLDDMALNACHAFVQFNCRPLTNWEQLTWLEQNGGLRNELTKLESDTEFKSEWSGYTYLVNKNSFDRIPNYYLDCQMYQRSADYFLGVPYNIASYALLTHIIAKICNMVPGDFIHTFGDVHIYDNHMDQVKEQLTRTPDVLPKLIINEPVSGEWSLENMFDPYGGIGISDTYLENYNPQSAIKAKLSTGLV